MLGNADLDLLEQLFEGLAESPFFAKDASLRYVVANAAMARLCGARRPADLIGRGARDFFPSADAERYEAFDRQVLAGGLPITNRLDFSVTRDGAPAWLLFSRVPIRNESGEVVGVAGTSRRLPAPNRHDPSYRRLAGAVERIRNRFDAPLNLGDLAAHAGISKSQLERDFRGLFGLTLQAFLHRTRIEHALRCLEGDRSVADIAQEGGYSDHSAFTRRFRALVGRAPRQYRRQIRTR